jgi:hypothetical protein
VDPSVGEIDEHERRHRPHALGSAAHHAEDHPHAFALEILEHAPQLARVALDREVANVEADTEQPREPSRDATPTEVPDDREARALEAPAQS